MSAMDRIEQQEREQSLSEMSALVEQLRNERQEDRRVLAQLIESQNSLTSMVEELSTSMNSGASSNGPDATLKLGGVKKRLTSLEEAVTALGASLASSETVQLADGSSLKKSDVEALTLMDKTVEMIGDLRSEHARLMREVASKAQPRIDYDRLAALIAPQLETRLIPQINASEERMKQAWKIQERQLDDLGSKKISEMKESLQDATKGLDRAEKTAARLKGALTWAGIGMVSVALLPYVFAATVVGMLLGLVGQMFGIPEIFGWAWASFVAAEAWWLKLIIAVTTIGSALGVCWIVYWFGNKAARGLSRMVT